MRVTIKDIAKRLNLHHTTVSRVLNGKDDGYTSVDTRQRVLETARAMHYTPNHSARALVTGRTNTIMLMVGALLPYHIEISNYVQTLVREHGYELLINSIDFTSESSGAIDINRIPADGIIAVGIVRQISPDGKSPVGVVPMVCFGSSQCDSVDSVGMDLYPASIEVVDHLNGIGCKRIMYVCNESEVGKDSRYFGYGAAMQALGREPEYIALPDISHLDSARNMIKSYVQDRGCPDGIFFQNDHIAIGAYRGLCDLGIRVPDDVALVGCDGTEMAEYLECPLSTIDIPTREMCATAWKYLQNRMADPTCPIQNTMFAPQLIVRESSRR